MEFPEFKSNFFNNTFLPLYKSKTKPDESLDGLKKEDRIGSNFKTILFITQKKLAEAYST